MTKLIIDDCRAVAAAASRITLEEGFGVLQRVNKSHLYATIYLDRAVTHDMQFVDLGDTRSNRYRLMDYLEPIWFLGGPPGAVEWYNGTPRTYFVDCLLHDILDKGRQWVFEALLECAAC